MRRYGLPFNGKQFVLNTNTAEVHNLDQESTACQIAKIKTNNIYPCDSYMEAETHSIMMLEKRCNGCAYCMPEKNSY